MENAMQGSVMRSELHFRGSAVGSKRLGTAKPWLRIAGSDEAVTLRIAPDDIEELRRALSSAYGEVIRELAYSSRRAELSGIDLCRRKWRIEAMLRQLDGPEEPPAVLKLVPRRKTADLEQIIAA